MSEKYRVSNIFKHIFSPNFREVSSTCVTVGSREPKAITEVYRYKKHLDRPQSISARPFANKRHVDQKVSYILVRPNELQ